jgi:hypothetical protein
MEQSVGINYLNNFNLFIIYASQWRFRGKYCWIKRLGLTAGKDQRQREQRNCKSAIPGFSFVTANSGDFMALVSTNPIRQPG